MLLDLPGDDYRMARAVRVRNLVEDFGQARRRGAAEAVDALLGAGSFDSLKAKAGTMLAGMDSCQRRSAPSSRPGRAHGRPCCAGACQAGQLRELAATTPIAGTSAYFVDLDRAGDGHRRHRRGQAGRRSSATCPAKVAAGDYSPHDRPRSC